MPDLVKTASPIGEDRLREAFHHAASGMGIADLDGRFHEANPAYLRIVGRSEQELSGETILSVTHSADRPACQQQLECLVAGEIDSFVIEKRYLRPGGDAVWVRNSFSLLKGDHVPCYIILICDDISDRRTAERLLLEREKLAVVGQLATSIAHEINNPLEAVMNLLYLAREADSESDMRSFLTQAEHEVERVAQIAKQTLHFHKDMPQPTPTRLADLLESVLVLFKGKLAVARVKVQFEKRDSPCLDCFPGELRQVLANLLQNAIEAMQRGGTLRVRLRPATTWSTGAEAVRITLADTGVGMDTETRRRIFDPFFTTKGSLGTGLGLWITASILAKHGGSMQVRSRTTPGNSGTVFAMVFPAHVSGDATASQDGREDNGARTGYHSR